MPRGLGERAIDLALTKARDRLHLVFFGGEPMLRFSELVAFTDHAIAKARPLGTVIRPTVTTNATLLTAERSAWLADHGFVVAVSCDGIQPAHDANRMDKDGRGSHEATWRGLEVALASGAKVRVVLVLHPRNLRWFPRSVEALVAAGANDLVVNPDWSADWSDPAVQSLWSEVYEHVADHYVQAYRMGKPFWLSTLDPKIAAHIKGGYSEADRCDLGQRNLVVAPSGNLYPCDRLVGCDRDASWVIGHVDVGVDRVAATRLVASAMDVPSDCLTCDVRSRCRNRCVCANVAMTGQAGTPSSILCFHEQLCMRTADDAAEALFAEGNELFVRRHYGFAIGFERSGLETT